ncbi:MAG: D-aminoacylase [Proteobacteria bacterium]|nr:D-aminoacylase [Pseudomonadota bacterium]
MSPNLRYWLSRATLLMALGLLSACPGQVEKPTSTLIENALVIDGTGSSGVVTNVRIDGDRIAEIGALTPRPGETVIDATGLVLAPGFIDSHSHHDGDLEDFPYMPAVLSQGVTTLVRGADGDSDVSGERRYLSQDDFNRNFAANPAVVNFASYSAHGSIRYTVMGDDYRRQATPGEIDSMKKLVDADMQAGAIGLSTGLEYEPGIYASTGELIELSRVVARYGGAYMSHLRDEDDRFMEALAEIVEIGRQAELRVHVSHIKLADRVFWGTANHVIETLEAARADGIEVSADIYPYLRWQSDISVLFPNRDFANVDVADYTFEHTAAPQDIVLIEYLPNPDFDGMSIADIARVTERDPVTTLLSLAQEADDYRKETGLGAASIIVKGMDEADVIQLMQWRYTNICSDGSHASGHPRGHGSFPRVLGRFVRELGIFSLEEAIFKMTGRTADAMGIRNRGRIEPGTYADLVLFDPETIADRATMSDPTAISVGVNKVWVNGVLAFVDGKTTKRIAGRVVTLD